MSGFNFLVQRKGRTATFNSNTSSTYDPATGSNTNTSTPYTVKAYFGEYELGETNNEVATGKRWVALGTVDTSGTLIPRPSTKDTISGAEDSVVIAKVQTIYEGENPVCYLCTAME